MKNKFHGSQWATLIFLLVVVNPAAAQSTAFTYNGRLSGNGSLVNGQYDLQFSIYDSEQNGILIAGPLPPKTVDVSGGLFTVRIDFGTGVFTGGPRWLEAGVRAAGGGGFTYLTRVELTSSPYSIRSQSTATADSGGGGVDGAWSVIGGNASYTNGNVGIGTATPATALEVDGIVRSSRIGNPSQYLQLEGGDPVSIRMTAQSIVGAEKNLIIRNLTGDATPGPNNSIQFALGTAASPSTKMTITKDGNVLMNPGGNGGTIQFGTPNFETGMTIIGANRADVRFDGDTLKLLAGTGGGIPASGNGIAVKTSGNVGIGTTAPVAKLHAETSHANLAAVYGNATGTGGVGVYGQSAPGYVAVHAEGNVRQPRDNGGFVKAMLYVNADGTISRCYNSFLTGNAAFTGTPLASTSPCGFSVARTASGEYTIDFGFQVNDRFFAVTPRELETPSVVYPVFATFNLNGVTPNQVKVRTREIELAASVDSPFMIIVY